MKRLSSSGHTSTGLRSKKAEEEQATIVWVDEAGFYLLPMAVRTWAPRGQTPVLRVKLTRDHRIAISGIPLDGHLFMQVRRASSDAVAVVAQLEGAAAHDPWEHPAESPMARRSIERKSSRTFGSRGAAKRLQVEPLAG